MTGEFDPAAYHDEYREALLKVIEAKVAGQETVEAAAAPKPTGNLVDLMAALEASVKAAARPPGQTTPVSVAEARAAKDAKAEPRPPRRPAAARRPAEGGRRGRGPGEAEAEPRPARPAAARRA